jgi:hypothetical protein
VRQMLEALGIELPIERADRAELVATLRSAHGTAILL